jgi:hypothetical protein
MRLLTAVLFLVLVVVRVEAAPFDGADDYKSHLEFLGYTVEAGDKSLIAKHPENYNISVRAYNGGVLVVTFFGTTDKAKSDRVGFYDFLNALNSDAVAARYYVDNEDDVIVEAWYPGTYDRSRFGLFLDKFNLISDQLNSSGAAADYLQ